MFGFVRRKIEEARGEGIEGRVAAMLVRGQDFAVFDDVAYEAARSYAVAKGAKAADAQSASARVVVGGETYFVVFCPALRGGTSFGIERAKEVRDRVLDRPAMERHVASGLRAAADGLKQAEAERSIARDIQQGVVRQPSWGDDRQAVADLLEAVFEAVQGAGMSPEIAGRWLQHKDVSDCVSTSAAQFEMAGFDRPGQIACAARFAARLAGAQIRTWSCGPA